ncbi:MAG: outer membrane beta-barrel protein [Thermoproteota archaeon]|jgi:outer membrane beta-barrel protein
MKLVLILLILIPVGLEAAESDLYEFLWLDPDKSVYVLQNKTHEKKKQANINLGYVRSLADFQDSAGYSISTGYFFTEELGIELSFSNFSHNNNTTYENIISVNNTEPFIRRHNSITSVSFIYSPFYGKINTFNQIYYFDVDFGIGLSLIDSESNLNYIDQSSVFDEYDKESYTALKLKMNLKLYLNKDYHLYGQVNTSSYMAIDPQDLNTKELQIDYDLNFGIGFNFN